MSDSNDEACLSRQPGLILGRTLPAKETSVGFTKPLPPISRSGELLIYKGDGHLMTFAPTGMGKSSGPVICNALTHPGQLIVFDIKGEIYKATAQARRRFGPVHVLDLNDENMHNDSLNPFDLAKFGGTETTAIARTLACDLIQRTEERDRFWNDMAETVITGTIAHLIGDRAETEQNLGKIFDMFHDDDVSYAIAVMLDSKAVLNKTAHKAFTSFLSLPDRETRPSVLGTIQTHLRLFDSALIRRLTGTTTIDLQAYITGAPLSIYINIPPHRLTAFQPILRIWLRGLILALTHRKSLPLERTLMLCDEIGSLGHIESFVTAMTLMRGWGLTLWSFWQNAAQLDIYGKQARTLLDNAAVIQILGARNFRMAQEFVDLIGGFSAEEILSLGPREQFLLIEGGRP